MRRFFIPSASFQAGATTNLPSEVLKHIRNVLRLKEGEEIELLDGRGMIAHCRLNNMTAKSGDAMVLATRQSPPPHLEIELIQGTTKGDKLDFILQKGTELGANHFTISSMERSIGRLKEERRAARLERWQKITQEAARQCNQAHLPSIGTAASVKEAVNSCRGELKLMLWEEETQPLPELLPVSAPSSISILVGPEGGMSTTEAEWAKSAGFKSVRLGPRILRTETAGLAIISILQYLYGDLSSGTTE